MTIHDSCLNTIGNTPVVKINLRGRLCLAQLTVVPSGTGQPNDCLMAIRVSTNSMLDQMQPLQCGPPSANFSFRLIAVLQRRLPDRLLSP